MENKQQDLNVNDKSVEEIKTQDAMNEALFSEKGQGGDTAATKDAMTAEEAADQEQPADCENEDLSSLQSEIETLKSQLKGEQEKAKAALESMARAAAESDNRRKRAEADVERERKYGNEKLLKALLPVVDSLELALQHINKDDEHMTSVREGIENTMALFLKELSSFGVTRLDPVGEIFDPNVHNAVSMIPANDVKPNHVAYVMQKGFLLNGRVVRPAMVAVAKGAATDEKKVNLEA